MFCYSDELGGSKMLIFVFEHTEHANFLSAKIDNTDFFVLDFSLYGTVQYCLCLNPQLVDRTFPFSVTVKKPASVMELQVLLGKGHRWRTFPRQG